MCRAAPDSAGGVVGSEALQVVRVLRVWLKGHRAQLLQIPRLWSTKVPSKICQSFNMFEIFISLFWALMFHMLKYFS